jgi:hypothetical protein
VSAAGGLWGSDLLDETGTFIRRFVVVSDQQRDALALFVAHTHALDAADTTPYIDVVSPLKRCGKTRLLEVLELLVHEPLPAVNASTSALFRTIEKRQPTLLLDEVDAIFSPKGGDKEELRGILNAGYRRGAFVYRMGGPHRTTLEKFPVFCPKVLAEIIGNLPDTIRDRSIPIHLQRRTKTERIERFHHREIAPQAHELRDRIVKWLRPQLPYLRSLRPALPDELDDRAQDIWEPLLAIAQIVGGEWPERARLAALALSTGAAREDDSDTVQLLRDIYTVFESSGKDRFLTADLISKLVEIEESPWGDWQGKHISPQALSRLLKPYEIRTMSIKIAGETVRGYKAEQFEEAWRRVLGVTRVTGVTSEQWSYAESNGSNASNGFTVVSRDGFVSLGDEGFVSFLADAFRNGHVTVNEAKQRWAVNRLLLATRQAA